MTYKIIEILLGVVFGSEPVAICDFEPTPVLQVKYSLVDMKPERIYSGFRKLKTVLEQTECHAMGLIVYPDTLQIIFGTAEELEKIGYAQEDYAIKIC